MILNALVGKNSFAREIPDTENKVPFMQNSKKKKPQIVSTVVFYKYL